MRHSVRAIIIRAMNAKVWCYDDVGFDIIYEITMLCYYCNATN